jgi:hypothetical protein
MSYGFVVAVSRQKCRASCYQYDTLLLFYLIFCLQYVIAYPISRGTMINFVGFKSRHDLENTKFNGPWVSYPENSELVSIFKGWEPEVLALVEVCQNSMNNGKKSSCSHTNLECR